MKRLHMDCLMAWYRDPKRKPLILDGARQVGKTWLVKEFGRMTFAKTAYINLMDNERMASLFAWPLCSHQIFLPSASSPRCL